MADSHQIKLDVLGGGGEVGANCFQLTINGYRLVLDSGTHPKKDGPDALPALSLLNRSPDALLVSHAHVDHCGSVPRLVKQFPSVRIHATHPTARIMDRMLHNSVAVMGLLSKERGIAGYPLYTHEDVNFAMSSVRSHGFEEEFSPSASAPITISFHHAGHVLGSASILIQSPTHNVFYTGDVCETNQELLAAYKPLDDSVKVDTLIIESTQGALEEGRTKDYGAEGYRLGEEIAKVVKEGGVAMIPCFALGRTQEMVNILSRLQEEGVIPEVPIYASGLGRAVYEIYDRFRDYLQDGAVLRPLDDFLRIGNVWNPAVAKKLLEKPAIIVATSGMMLENTPSAMIAREMVQDTRHGIFFVGYVDHETLGYKVLNSEPGAELEFELGAPATEVKLRNIQRFHFSAHAPRKALQEIVERLKPKNVVYVHGDPDAIAWMKANTPNGATTYTPQTGQSILIGT